MWFPAKDAKDCTGNHPKHVASFKDAKRDLCKDKLVRFILF